MADLINVEGMKVLSIDDISNNLMIIEAYSKQMGLGICSFQKPEKALESVKTQDFDIVIVDYMMPEMDGIQFIQAFRELDADTPIIMVTAVTETDLQLEALRSGATDFLTKPLNGPIFRARVLNLLRLKKSLKLIADRAEHLAVEVEKATNMIVEREKETLEKLGKIAEYKDPETKQHIYRVAHYSRIIGEAYGLSEKLVETLFYGAPLHDIGKVGIPDTILLKDGTLSRDEWNIMKEHAIKGYDLLKDSDSPYLKAGSIIAYSHHERYDGTGYPNGLKGEMIPIFGRILAVVDVFDALCSVRPYKDAWDFEDAFQYIVEKEGSHFDPICVKCFAQSKEEIREIYDTYKDEVG